MMTRKDQRSSTLKPILMGFAVALFVSSCAEDGSVTEEESAPSTSATERTGTEANERPDADYDEPWKGNPIPDSVPISEEHLAEGIEMPQGCLGEAIHVEEGTVLGEADLAQLCPTEPAEDRVFRPSQQIMDIEGNIDIQYLDGEEGAGVEVYHLHCEDPDALAEKAEHNGESQPAGWPQDWDDEGPMPDPYCHPDYLEIGEWEHLEEFASVWKGIETSTLVDSGQPQAEIDQHLWEQSQARAEWTP